MVEVKEGLPPLDNQARAVNMAPKMAILQQLLRLLEKDLLQV